MNKSQRLNGLLSEADDLLLAGPLSDADVCELEARSNRLDVQDPGDHTVPIRSYWGPEWLERIGKVPDATSISRAEVSTVARRCSASADPDWTPCLIASFIWGAGPTGYGPSRLSHILDQPLRGASVAERLRAAVNSLEHDGTLAAYRTMRYGSNKIPNLGPAFFTKFLHFASAHCTVPTESPRPLILDAVVAGRLRRRTRELLTESPLEGTSPSELAAWAWSNGSWHTGRYETYLRWAEAATKVLLDRPNTNWPDRTDATERAYFSWGASAQDKPAAAQA